MANLMDFMTDDEKNKVKERFKARITPNDDYGVRKISPERYMLAEFGYYYGWQAVLSVIKNEITFEEMFALLEGAKKVWYAKLIEEAKTTRVAFASTLVKSEDAQRVFDEGMQPFRDNLELEE